MPANIAEKESMHSQNEANKNIIAKRAKYIKLVENSEKRRRR